MRTIRWSLIPVVLILFAAPSLGKAPDGPLGALGAAAFGANEVPPVDSDGLAQLQIIPVMRGEAMRYRLLAFRLENIVAAHIHLGAPGQNGPVVAFLFGPADPPVTPNTRGPRRGQLASGVLTADDLVGPLAGAPLSDLLDEIRAGNTYVNVHTESFPSGEVRGQIVPIRDSV